ncbi:hypothetical protein D3C71_2054300 [compost metagenome]
MPLAAPVINATLPVSLPTIVSSCCCVVRVNPVRLVYCCDLLGDEGFVHVQRVAVFPDIGDALAVHFEQEVIGILEHPSIVQF